MKFLKGSKAKIATLVVSSLAVVALTTTTAHAALNSAASSAMTDISTGIVDAESAAWPLIGGALAAGIIIKLVKRFSNKV